MSWSQNFPNVFDNVTTTNQVLKNTDNETKRLYTLLNQLFASNGHAHAGLGSDGAKIEFKDVKNSPLISVASFGALADGTTDFTTEIQAALDSVDSGTIYFPEGNYIISDTLIIKPEHKIIGAGRLSTYITQTNNTKYAFSLDLLPTINFVSTDIENMCINSKYGIRINSKDTTTDFTTAQGFPLGVKISYVNFIGRLYEISDPYKNTNTVPTFDELYAQGVAIAASKIFDSQIEMCQFTNLGVGIWFRGCDINVINNCRFTLNSRHYHGMSVIPGDGNHYGSQNKILNSDILVHYRIGGIWTNEWWDGIQNNYFECRTPAAQYIITDGDRGTLIADNRFDSTNNPNTPIISTAPAYSNMITGNRFNPNGQTYKIDVKNTNYDYTKPVLLTCKDNAPEFPVPDYPHVLIAEYNPNLVKYNNIGISKYNAFTGALSANWLWQYNATALTYTIVNSNPSIAFVFNLQNMSQRRYKINISCRKATLTPAYNYAHSIRYAGYGESETTIISGNIGVVSSTLLETITRYVRIPDTSALTLAHITVELNNADIDVAAVELVPIDYEMAPACPTANTYKVGDKVYNSAPTLIRNISYWECIVAGTPGTWVAYGTGTGTTAQRPALTVNDAGYSYKDTSTNNLILWNGTAWV